MDKQQNKIPEVRFPEFEDEWINKIGLLAQKYWIEISNHFPFVELGNFVIMPNHTHGILIIDKSSEINAINNVVDDVETLHCNVSTLPTSTPTKMNRWQKYLQRQVPYQPLFVPTNRLYQKMHAKYTQILHGNHVFTIILYVIIIRL